MNTIKNGSRGSDVKTLQQLLHLQADGIFGILTEEAVKEFQKDNGLVVDGIVGPATWGKLTANQSVLLKSKRSINELIVHCTATRAGVDCTIEDITRWHKKRGFTTIGYHYVIFRDGTVAPGRDVNVSGAHCLNHNSHSIGICYVGGLTADGKKTDDTRTPAQKASMESLLRKLKSIYPNAKIIGHRDTSPDKNHNGLIEPNEWIKDCPCFDAQKEYKNL